MRSSTFGAAFALLSLAWNAAAQTSTIANLKPIQTMDCYKSNGTLHKVEEYDFASDGWCQRLCGNANYPVMAMTAGSICYCGSSIPPRDQIVPSTKCNSPCNGFNLTTCGGFGFYQIYLTGLTNDVKVDANGTSSSSSSASPSVTKIAETVVVTSASASGSGPNKVGIAVGVIVGIVAMGGMVGGLIYYFKQKQKAAIEEEHRRLEAATAAAAEKSDAASSRTDQRLDPSNIYNNRRESIGSIADEMDFSRRILQVRNPDRYSTNSPVP